MTVRQSGWWIGITTALFAGWMYGASCVSAIEATGSADSPFDLRMALDRAEPGDTITLPLGTYTGPFEIEVSLTLQAEREGEAILVNTDDRPALSIRAEQTTVSGLVIVDEAVKEEPTVLVTAHGVKLEKLRIRTGAHGIAARDADDGVVSQTVIDWVAEAVSMADKGNGVDLFNSHRWSMTGNTIRDVHDGIYMENSDQALVSGNVIERSRYGVHCMYTQSTKIIGNLGHLNVTGAMVMTARGVDVRDNVFAKQSENVNSQGILLYDAHDSVFAGNEVEGNRVGFYVEQSSGNRLEGNRVGYNFTGIQLLDASGNTISGNSFVGNVADAQARGSENNAIIGNYWDSFRGIDANGDGMSDLSYAINPFFQAVARKRAAFQLFFQSPGMVFLESLYETDRQSWATDRSPLMVPPDAEGADGPASNSAVTGAVGAVLLSGSAALFYTMRRRNG